MKRIMILTTIMMANIAIIGSKEPAQTRTHRLIDETKSGIESNQKRIGEFNQKLQEEHVTQDHIQKLHNEIIASHKENKEKYRDSIDYGKNKTQNPTKEYHNKLTENHITLNTQISALDNIKQQLQLKEESFTQETPVQTEQSAPAKDESIEDADLHGFEMVNAEDAETEHEVQWYHKAWHYLKMKLTPERLYETIKENPTGRDAQILRNTTPEDQAIFVKDILTATIPQNVTNTFEFKNNTDYAYSQEKQKLIKIVGEDAVIEGEKQVPDRIGGQFINR